MWTYKLHNLCRSVINLIKSEKEVITTFLTLMMGIIGDAGICMFNKGHLSTKNCL